MKTVALTTGKFLPMHIGHELMIDVASKNFDEVIVVVSSLDSEHPDHPTLEERTEVMRSKYDGTNVRVTCAEDVLGTPAVDSYGTSLDPEYIEHWARCFSFIGGPELTHFVTSDRYGEEVAELMGVEWFPVDPAREVFNVSSTQIRHQPNIHWRYIVDEFKPFYRKTIGVIGAESSGKSTMVKNLAHAYGSGYVPEYGRILSERKPDLTEDDFDRIIDTQQTMIDSAIDNSTNGVTIVDTEALVTYLFANVYLGIERDDYLHYFDTQPIDFYLLLKHDIPYVDDGTRILTDKKDRDAFHKNLKHHLKMYGKDYAVIKGQYNRLGKAVEAIETHFKND